MRPSNESYSGKTSLARQGSEIHFDFSVAIKEIKKKKQNKNRVESYLGEKTFVTVDRMKVQPNEINACGKRHVIPEELRSFFHALRLVFVHSVYKALFVSLIVFSSMKEAGINFSL